ncbi:MAG: O-antigen ligase family protein, partial [Thermodesulfobacteriota bacterium]|nr:O-antigen ligase family protein [Thermodesulfobacteriota bacterium]
IALGSMEVWAFSLMELGILLIIVLYVIQESLLPPSSLVPRPSPRVLASTHSRIYTFTILISSLFLALILFQMIPLPAEMVKTISPKTYELRSNLVFNDLITNVQSPITYGLSPISFFPFATKIEFFKWLTLTGLFLFLLHWKLLSNGQRTTKHLIIVIMLVGIAESFYGMFEYFSGRRHILYLEGTGLMSSVMGTFINRNYFAGYLLMVIPLSVGFLLAREASQTVHFKGWRHRLASLDGKTILLGFGVILMILGLLFSASRMGIISLLLSITLISFFPGRRHREQKFSRSTVLIFSLALLWAAWIGLDAVISRFFSASEDFKMRWAFWVNTFQIFKDFPLLGSGLGTFTQIFPMYRSFHIRGFVTHAENDFLQLASETGLIGIGLLFVLFLFLFIKALAGLRSLPSLAPQRYIAVGGLVGILALMFHSLVERNIQVPANAFLFTFIWALVLKHSFISNNQIT